MTINARVYSAHTEADPCPCKAQTAPILRAMLHDVTRNHPDPQRMAVEARWVDRMFADERTRTRVGATMSAIVDETQTLHYWTCPMCGVNIVIQNSLEATLLMKRLFDWDTPIEFLLDHAPWIGEQAEQAVEEHEASHLPAVP